MKKILFFSFLTALIVLACSKDKFQTKPQLTLKSIDKTVDSGQNFRAIIQFTDMEGDVQDTMFFKKRRVNMRATPVRLDSFFLQIPDFPKRDQGEFEINIGYSDISAAINPIVPGSNPRRREPDTLQIRIAVQDNAGNTSDTLVINDVVIIR